MQFDWFTFGAQIINFAILLVLLRRFLYQPIMAAMRAREEKIAAHFQEAEAARQEAHREAELFQQKRDELAEQRANLMADATTDAQKQRKQLLSEARQEVDEMRKRWLATLGREKATHLHKIRQQMITQLFAIVQRALRELANATLEEQMLIVFAQRLQQMEHAERLALIQAVQNSRQRAVVRTAFDLGEKQRAALTSLLHDFFADDVQVLFEHAPDLLCGIELQVYGHRVSWSLHDYIETLEEQLTDLFDAHNIEDAALMAPHR